MKIALVIQHADAGRGGAERYTLQLAATLARGGHEVTLLAETFGTVPQGVLTVQVGEARGSRAARYWRLLDGLDAELEQRRYDVVHAMLPVRRCDFYHPHAGLAAETVAASHLRHANPVVRSIAKISNTINAKRQAYAQVEGELLRSERRPVVLCLSKAMKEVVRKYYPEFPEARLATLFNAVDLERFEAGRDGGEAEDDQRRVALLIANFFSRKGAREAIAAMARVGDPRLRLRIVGKEDPSACRRLAQRLGVGDRVEFRGTVADTKPLYREADFFVLPTPFDQCSLVVLEALAMGLPVITTRANGAAEIMQDGVHGVVLDDPTDVGTLAQAMKRMLDDGKRQRMATAVTSLRPHLAFTTHIDRLLNLYVATKSEF